MINAVAVEATPEAQAAFRAAAESSSRPLSKVIEVKIPNPDPLPALPGVAPFDYAYLPDALRDYVRDISERMQCPPDFGAVGGIVMLSTIIGRKVGIRPMRNNDWTVIPNLWGAIVGHSGALKSPTLKDTLSPIKKLQARAFESFNAAKSEYDAKAELAQLQ